jgi:hypothetical protein
MANRELRMIGSHCLLEYPDRPLQQYFRLIPAAFSHQKHCEIIGRDSHIRVHRTQQFLFHLQRASKQEFRLDQVTFGLLDPGEIIQIYCDLIMLRTVHAFEHCNRLMIQRLGVLVAAQSIQNTSEGCRVGGSFRVRVTKCPRRIS